MPSQQTENKGVYNRPMSAEESRRSVRGHLILLGSGLVFMIFFFLLVHFEAVRLYPSKQNADTLSKFPQKMEFALRYQTLLVGWLVFNILVTIYGRATSNAFNPLNEETEEHVLYYKSILANSLEQIVVSVLAQLVFVAYASPEAVLEYIPLINIIQFIGRIAFFIGYPLKRGFGFNLSFLPTIIILIFNFFYFLKFLFLE